MAKDLRIKLKIDSDTGELIVTQREFGKLSKAIDKTSEVSKAFNQTLKNMAGYALGFFTIKEAFDAIKLGFKSLLETSSQFEKYGSTLETIEGSSKKAKESLSWIQDFAKNTPYELDQVTEAFVQMRAYGLTPTDGSLKSLGDAASAMNKPIMQAVEAMADAMTGENERLKEFGIRASTQGDEIAYNWTDSSGKAKHIIIKNNSEIIQSTLEAIFNSKYQDAMQNQMKTYDGMISNLKDQWTQFKKDFMDAGLFAWIKAFIKTFTESFIKSFSLVDGEQEKFTSNMIDGFNTTIDAVGFLYRAFLGLKTVFNVVYLGWLGFRTLILSSLQSMTELINGLIDSYNSVVGKNVTFKGKALTVDVLPDFKAELDYVGEEVKKTYAQMGEDFDKSVANPEKFENFKTNLLNNYKDIKSETDKIVESIKAPVPGAVDGQFQFGSGGTKKTEEEKAAEKEKKRLEAETKRALKEESKAINEAYEDRRRMQEQFTSDYMYSQLTQSQYQIYELNNQYADYAKYIDDKVALDKWYESEKKEILKNRAEDEKNWLDGVNEAFDDYIEHAGNSYRQMNNLFSNALYGMEDFLVDFIKTGKASFSDFINSIAEDFIRMMVQINITKPLATAASSINWGSMFSGFAFANGGIMTNQGAVPLKAYANGGVASTPQLALFGEGRMPEAYVPLPDGRTIPVTMKGGNSGTNIVLNIENKTGQSIDASQISQMTKVDSEGKKTEIISIVMDAYNRNTMQLRDLLKGGR